MLKNRIEYLFIVFISIITQIIGVKRIESFAGVLARLFFYFLPIRKKTVFRNLEIAFPEKSKSEIEKIAFRSYRSVILIMLEILLISKMGRDDFFKILKSNNTSIIDKVYDRGKGVILLTAHFGNWELGAIALGMSAKTEFNVLVKAQSNKYINDWLTGIRERFGNKVIFLGPSVRNIYKALREKKIVGMVGDQRGHIDSRRIMLFNQPTAVFTGTAELALKMDVPILIVLGKRIKAFEYDVHIEEIPISEFKGSFDEKVDQINAYYFNVLEKKIRETPEQWFWMHKIWKY